MAITTYNFSIADDTANGKVSPRNLDQEIRNEYAITIELSGVSIVGDDLNIDFLAPLSVDEETALDNVVSAHTGEVTILPPAKFTTTGVPFMMPSWKEGNPTDFISFNWCDKTTWHEQAIRVTNEVLVEDSATQFSSANTFWIDITHGRIPQEHRLLSSHSVLITVDDVAVDESSPGTTDADYQINYETGVVTFNASQTGKSVKATYSYATTSDFYIEPLEGTTIRLTAVEVQFSTDVDLTDSVQFDIEGHVEAFAPHLVDDVSPDYVSSFPTGTRIPLHSPRIYKTMHDYIAEAQRAYPLIPALGGNSWRGMPEPVYVMRWPYQEDATRDLNSSSGMRIRMRLLNNIPFNGTMAICTLYAVSSNED